MGFLADLKKLNDLSNESQARSDVKGSMAEMQGKLNALNASMAPTDPQADARRITTNATVTAAAPTGMVVNFNPVIALDLTVFLGGAPLPVHTTAVVAQLDLARVQPGSMLTVSVDPANLGSMRIDWSR